MERRSSKYIEEEISTQPKSSRSSKNRTLYSEINDKIGYGEIVGLPNYGKVELDKNTPIKTREEYQKTKEINLLFDEQAKEEKVEEEKPVEKVYDINTVLESAKKNRSVTDEADKRRKLQDMEYNILTDLNQKYISKKEKMDENLEKEGIRELIDTITSKTLVEDLKKEELDSEEEDDGKDLMSDLMATSALTAISNEALQEELAKEILNEEAKREEEKDEDLQLTKQDGKIVNSFYTRSMDLSEQDFEIRDEILEENKARRKILILVVLIILIIIAIVGLVILNKLDIL